MLFYTFLCRHCMATKQDVKVPSLTFYGGRTNKPGRIFSFFLTWILWLWGTPEKFGYTKWVSWNNRDEDWNSANGLTAFAVLGSVRCLMTNGQYTSWNDVKMLKLKLSHYSPRQLVPIQSWQATTSCKNTWDTVPYLDIDGMSMTLTLWFSLLLFQSCY